MQVRLRGLPYVSGSGVECAPHSLVDLPTDEAVRLITENIADLEDPGAPVVENMVAKPPVMETRDVFSEAAHTDSEPVEEVAPPKSKGK